MGTAGSEFLSRERHFGRVLRILQSDWFRPLKLKCHTIPSLLPTSHIVLASENLEKRREIDEKEVVLLCSIVDSLIPLIERELVVPNSIAAMSIKTWRSLSLLLLYTTFIFV